MSRQEIDDLFYQKEICRMATDGTMDGTDCLAKIYHYMLVEHKRSSEKRLIEKYGLEELRI